MAPKKRSVGVGLFSAASSFDGRCLVPQISPRFAKARHAGHRFGANALDTSYLRCVSVAAVLDGRPGDVCHQRLADRVYKVSLLSPPDGHQLYLQVLPPLGRSLLMAMVSEHGGAIDGRPTF